LSCPYLHRDLPDLVLKLTLTEAGRPLSLEELLQFMHHGTGQLTN
jgi:hypothetical protein